MEVLLPLEKMSINDKLRVLERIWEDLCRTSEDIPSPSWHDDVLHAREKRANEGSSQFQDWNEAKKSIKESVK